jgi:hypothetical protein
VAYQVSALRQVIPRLSETMVEFDLFTLRQVMKNLPRTGTDPIYEPLDATGCSQGLQSLVALGVLTSERPSGPWRIVGTM